MGRKGLAALECPCCSVPNGRVFYQVERTPANSCLLIGSRREALDFPMGRLSLACCRACGFIWNSAFDPALIEYSENYEETQGFSETFGRFHRQLALDLIATYDLRGKHILEIGCGKGEFLVLLSELGANTGVGFDPTFRRDRLPPGTGRRLEFIQDLYSEKYAEVRGDFICCKMTLEHIAKPFEFVQMLRRTLGDDSPAVIFILVPDAARMIATGAFEDIFYEHCSYFTRLSLAGLFQRCGFQILSIESVYGGQYVALTASVARQVRRQVGGDDKLAEFQSAVADFEARSNASVQRWRRSLADWCRDGRKVVVWGSGSKAVGFLTAVQDSGSVAYVVDINPHKAGTFMAGTGQQIIAPEDLQNDRPDVVIVMNAVYRSEISAQLSALGLEPLLLTLRDDVPLSSRSTAAVVSSGKTSVAAAR